MGATGMGGQGVGMTEGKVTGDWLIRDKRDRACASAGDLLMHIVVVPWQQHGRGCGRGVVWKGRRYSRGVGRKGHRVRVERAPLVEVRQ